jgi:ubiquinone/menaquinone biosynthesis C-methylase UbiE
MIEQWNSRYSTEEFIYGTQPNKFFVEQLDLIKVGKLLLPAEGEGRNALYAASKGWNVTAFDYSDAARQKALKSAKKQQLHITYKIASFNDFKAEENSFDCIAIVFAHVTDGNRRAYHKKLVSFLKPGGKFILECFSKQQMSYNSGGPKNLDFLYSKEELEGDFMGLSEKNIECKQVTLSEGPLHQGVAEVIRVTGIK